MLGLHLRYVQQPRETEGDVIVLTWANLVPRVLSLDGERGSWERGWYSRPNTAPVLIVLNMSLFGAASRQFVKDTGRLSLHPVLDLNSAIYCRILCIVEKKKSRFFWKKPKYLPTPFHLNDLLGQTDGGTKQVPYVFTAPRINSLL